MQSGSERNWVPDLMVGLVVLVIGTGEALVNLITGLDNTVTPWIVTVGIAASIALVRHAGWWSLTILWLVFIVQAASVTDVMMVQLAVIGVAFGLARWGSRPLLWASGVSIPIATVFSLAYIGVLANGIWATRIARNLIIPLTDAGISWPLVVLPLIAGILALPWLAGLATRYAVAARTSRQSQEVAEADAALAHRERTQMEEIALLREGQARLARDVHDVVGHSLTVILAQAESAQFVDGADTEAIKRTMANIALTARSSLQEVRAVLSSPDGATQQRTDLDELIDATRASGTDIVVADSGTPRPLPPELGTVAFRVLQEMLTNAIKHGTRDSAITVTRDWGEQLRINVTNHAEQDAAASTDGKGLEGMRRRLASVGGSFEVLDTAPVFTASASLPIRATHGTERVNS